MQWLRLLTLISADGVQFLTKAAVFLIVSLSKCLSLCFLCSEQHVKYRMPRGFPLTSSLLLDYHFKQNVHTKDLTNVLVYVVYCSEGSCGKVKNKNKKMNVSSFGNKGLTVDFYLGRVPKYYSI